MQKQSGSKQYGPEQRMPKSMTPARPEPDTIATSTILIIEKPKKLITCYAWWQMTSPDHYMSLYVRNDPG